MKTKKPLTGEPQLLNWKFIDDFGRWVAASGFRNEGALFYFIHVREDGTFSVSKTHRDLFKEDRAFESLAAARGYCQEREMSRENE